MFVSFKTLKMKNSLVFIVFYVLSLGSCSSASSSATTTTLASLNSTFITTVDNTVVSTRNASATPSTKVSTFPTTEVSETTGQHRSFSTGTGLKDPSTTTKITTTITTCSGPWRVLTYALSAVSGVLLLAFTTTVIILCKMRTKLGQASKTLYPITPGPDDHEYLDLEEGIRKNNKVELTNITKTHEEEEFDSPTFSPTPPAKPKRFFKNPPPVPKSKPPTDKLTDGVPQLPMRGKNKSNPSIGETNGAFVKDETNIGDGEMYESYEHGNNTDLTDGMEDDDDMDIQGPYEEPVKSSIGVKEQLLQRQGSSTGLPNLAVQRIPSREQIQDAPLPVDEEEVFDHEDFGNLDPESGLPDITGMHNIDDLQFFDDPDAMTAQVNGNDTNTEDTNDSKDNEDERRDTPSPTTESLDDLLTYDDADMEIADFDINKDDGDEPGLYEDFDINNENEIHSAFDREENANKGDIANEESSRNSDSLGNDLQEKNTTGESELPIVPPRRKSTFDKISHTADQPVLVTAHSDIGYNESSGVPDQTSFPSVPKRRDILIKQSESESAVGGFDEMDLINEKPPDIHWDTFPANNDHEDIVQLRPGKKVGVQGQERPRDSYFLYMEDKPVELNEANPDDVSGMSALTEISDKIAGLNEQMDTNTGFVAPAVSEDSESERRSNKYLFDMATGTDKLLHINGNVANTRGSGVEDGGFSSSENSD